MLIVRIRTRSESIILVNPIQHNLEHPPMSNTHGETITEGLECEFEDLELR